MNILQKYNFLTPFKGNEYDSMEVKVLFIGESHYVENDLNNSFTDYSRIVNHLTNESQYSNVTEGDFARFWYESSENYLKDNLDLKNIYWFNTLKIVREGVIDKFINGEKVGREKKIIWYPAFIYNETLGIDDTKLNRAKALENFSFMNYFARPSLIQGASIKNNLIDDKMAYIYLKEIDDLLRPDRFVFLSKKSYYAFRRVNEEKQYFDSEKILGLSHTNYLKAWGRKGSDRVKLSEFFADHFV